MTPHIGAIKIGGPLDINFGETFQLFKCNNSLQHYSRLNMLNADECTYEQNYSNNYQIVLFLPCRLSKTLPMLQNLP